MTTDSCEELIEILDAANDWPDKTAADTTIQDRVRELLLSPVERLVVEGGAVSLPSSTRHSEHPQYIAEYRCKVPSLDQLRGNLRVALRDSAQPLSIGVTVCQAWADTTKQ